MHQTHLDRHIHKMQLEAGTNGFQQMKKRTNI